MKVLSLSSPLGRLLRKSAETSPVLPVDAQRKSGWKRPHLRNRPEAERRTKINLAVNCRSSGDDYGSQPTVWWSLHLVHYKR
mgnify:CR=1 FL=1